MNKIFVLLVTVAALQVALCEIRDQVLAKRRLDAAIATFSKVIAEAEKIVSKEDQKGAQGAANGIAGKTVYAIAHLNEGIKGNTRNNEQGKQLYAISTQGDELEKWLKTNLQESGATKVVENIKIAAQKYSKLTKDVGEALPDLKKSTENYEKGVNELTQFIDVTLGSAEKLFANIIYNKHSNADLRKTINKILEQDLALLKKVSPEADASNEMKFHATQLRYMVLDVKQKLTEWLEKTNPKSLELKVALEKAISESTKMVDDIVSLENSQPSSDTLKASFKLWLPQLVTRVTSIQGTSDHYERLALFDILGFVVKFNSLFEYLAKP